MKARDIRDAIHDYIESLDKKDVKKDYFSLDVSVDEDGVYVEYSGPDDESDE